MSACLRSFWQRGNSIIASIRIATMAALPLGQVFKTDATIMELPYRSERALGALSFSCTIPSAGCGVDPNGFNDRCADYWEQNTRHALINHLHCVQTPINIMVTVLVEAAQPLHQEARGEGKCQRHNQHVFGRLFGLRHGAPQFLEAADQSRGEIRPEGC